ncbi:MAG: sulfite exporter TauE/SafE family protein [Burkholderiales bacterium]
MSRRAAHAAVALLCAVAATGACAATVGAAASPWWAWPLALFVVCFLIGIVAVPAGVGGGVLFVPIIGSFFPFDLDFVRAAGLLVALASSLAAAPNLLRTGLADLRLALPMALVASIAAVPGVLLGLVLPAAFLQVALGLVILAIVVLMLVSRQAELPSPPPARHWASLAIRGTFRDRATGNEVRWHVHRIPTGCAAFALNGLLGGMFGVGAGWANVPTLNLLMGAPLKIAVGTSSVILSLASASAVWTYANAGAVLPIVAAPAMIGTMLGARIGAHLLSVLKATHVRRVVIVVLFIAGLRAIAKGLGT